VEESEDEESDESTESSEYEEASFRASRSTSRSTSQVKAQGKGKGAVTTNGKGKGKGAVTTNGKGKGKVAGKGAPVPTYSSKAAKGKGGGGKGGGGGGSVHTVTPYAIFLRDPFERQFVANGVDQSLSRPDQLLCLSKSMANRWAALGALKNGRAPFEAAAAAETQRRIKADADAARAGQPSSSRGGGR
jgi:hypothetical protein